MLRCPGGHQTTSKERNTTDTGWKFTCAHCALQAQCLAVLPQHKGRSVIKNEYQPEYAAARQRATPEAYQAVRRKHPRVERKLADIVCIHGGRRTRYRRRWRVLSTISTREGGIGLLVIPAALSREEHDCLPDVT